MNIEKTRKEFEEWFRSTHHWPPEDNPLAISDNGSYFAISVSGKWRAWQASRAAIEVELPDYTSQFYGGDHFDECQYAADCEKAIESLGLKVKQ